MDKSFKKRVGLGKGLGALLSENDSYAPSSNNEKSVPVFDKISSINEVAISLIETNPFQPRTHFDTEALQELADSIKIQGIIQPITIRQIAQYQYQLISGERRLQAARMIGMTTIPAYVRLANDQQMLEMALIENIQRENLNPIEIALSYQRLLNECNLKHEELGERVGKNRSTVNNYVRLLKLPPVVQAALRDAKISMGHARPLISVEDSDVLLVLFGKIMRENWSVRKVEEAVRMIGVTEVREKPKKYDSPIYQQELGMYLGAKVSIKSNQENRGEIKISFNSKEELERIIQSIVITQRF